MEPTSPQKPLPAQKNLPAGRKRRPGGGRKPKGDVPRARYINVRVDDEVNALVLAWAARRGVTKGEIGYEAVQEWLRNHPLL